MDTNFDEGATDDPVFITTESPPFAFGDYTQRVIVATMFLVVTVVGTIGNSLVIVAVLVSKKLHMTTVAFIVNLSIADLLTSLVILWDAVALLGKTGSPFDEWVCRVVAVVQFTTVGCSIYTLAAVGLNRLVLITRPMSTYRAVYTPRKTAVWLAITWLIPFLATTIPLLVGFGAVGYNARYHVCGFIPSGSSSYKYNPAMIAILSPTVPIIVVSYTLIWWCLRKHAKRVHRSLDEPRDMSTANDLAATPAKTDAGHGRSASRFTRRQSEITKNMLYVVCASTLCFAPFCIALLFENDAAPVLPYLGVILFLNSCVDPFIYATKHRDFKTVLRCILRRQWDDIPEPSNFLKTVRRNQCCCGRRDLLA